ncbi:MAG TPA: hypothetical protein PKA91_05655, partial [Leptospiraceae bacterium]|nr:hypothetical protein [Leptospiraceae bacterium]
MDPYTAPESIPSPSSEKKNTAAQQALRNPATILLILAILSLFALPVTALGQLMKKTAENQTFLDSALEKTEKQDAKKSEAFRKGEQFGEFVGKVLAFTLWAISLPIQLIGFWRMRQGRSYGLSLAAAILACIPCFSSCCGIMLPFAIWS